MYGTHTYAHTYVASFILRVAIQSSPSNSQSELASLTTEQIARPKYQTWSPVLLPKITVEPTGVSALMIPPKINIDPLGLSNIFVCHNFPA